MRLSFVCKLPNGTCGLESPHISEAKFRLPTGSEIIIDRDQTDYTMEDDYLSMEWRGCYLWAIDDNFIFDEPTAYLNVSDGTKLLEDAELVELMVEDDAAFDADGDYKVEVTSWCAS